MNPYARAAKRYAKTISKDLWGFAVQKLVSLYLRDPESCSSVLDLAIPTRLLEKLKYWSNVKSMETITALHIMATTLFLGYLITGLLIYLILSAHLFYPRFCRLASAIALPMFTIMFCKIIDEKKLYKPIYSSSVIFSAYRLYWTFSYHNPEVYAIARKFLDHLGQQNLEYFAIIGTRWLMALVDLVILRNQDLNVENEDLVHRFFLVVYLISYVYNSAYSMRECLLIYHANRRLPLVYQFNLLDSVYVFFNARCFSVFKTLALLASFVVLPYSVLVSKFRTKLLEFRSTRASICECAVVRRSFVEHVLRPGPRQWTGETQRKMNGVCLREDMLASALIGWMLLHTCLCYVQDQFIRMPESFFLFFVHYMGIVEMFNSCIFIDFYKCHYGLKESLKSREILEDSVVVSTIEVTSRVFD